MLVGHDPVPIELNAAVANLKVPSANVAAFVHARPKLKGPIAQDADGHHRYWTHFGPPVSAADDGTLSHWIERAVAEAAKHRS